MHASSSSNDRTDEGGRSDPPTTAVVDLFCGAGGLTRGLLDAGLDVKAGVDIDPVFEHPYETNNQDVAFVEADVSKIEAADLEPHFEDADHSVLVGCAPCQPFSMLSHGSSADEHEKWGLLKHFGKLVDDLKPDVVSMENVPNLRKADVFDRFVQALEGIGYYVHYEVVFCPDYGVPQARRRLVLLASRLGPIELREPTHGEDEHPTVRTHIGEQPGLSAGDQHEDDRLHKVAGLSDTNLRRIRQSEPGGTWRDWDDELKLACHTRESGRSYSGVYGRMDWEEPGPTVTTQFYNLGSGRFGHPEDDRALSLREGALLQTFPEDYRFVPPDENVQMTKVGVMVGNAVPVDLGKAVGESILTHLRSER